MAPPAARSCWDAVAELEQAHTDLPTREETTMVVPGAQLRDDETSDPRTLLGGVEEIVIVKQAVDTLHGAPTWGSEPPESGQPARFSRLPLETAAGG